MKAYIRDKKSGNILPIENGNVLSELERNNQELIKQGKAHLIQFEVVQPEHEIINIDEFEKPKRKPGRKPAKK